MSLMQVLPWRATYLFTGVTIIKPLFLFCITQTQIFVNNIRPSCSPVVSRSRSQRPVVLGGASRASVRRPPSESATPSDEYSSSETPQIARLN